MGKHHRKAIMRRLQAENEELMTLARNMRHCINTPSCRECAFDKPLSRDCIVTLNYKRLIGDE